MLGQRLRRWPNIEPSQGQLCNVLAGISVILTYYGQRDLRENDENRAKSIPTYCVN